MELSGRLPCIVPYLEDTAAARPRIPGPRLHWKLVADLHDDTVHSNRLPRASPKNMMLMSFEANRRIVGATCKATPPIARVSLFSISSVFRSSPTISCTSATKLLGQTVAQLSEEIRVQVIQVPGTIDLQDTAVQACPENFVVTCVVFKLVHGVLEAEHLFLFSPGPDVFKEGDGLHQRKQHAGREMMPR